MPDGVRDQLAGEKDRVVDDPCRDRSHALPNESARLHERCGVRRYDPGTGGHRPPSREVGGVGAGDRSCGVLTPPAGTANIAE